MEKTLILHLPLYHKQVIRYPGSLDDLRAAMPEYHFTVMREWANAVDVQVTKKRRAKGGRIK